MAALTLLAGCGGGGDAEPTAAPTTQAPTTPPPATTAPTTEPATTPPPAPVAMPKVEGQRLDVAKSNLTDAGLTEDRIEVVGGGTFGAINESAWFVCDQKPDAGKTVTGKARVSVDREGACDSGDNLG